MRTIVLAICVASVTSFATPGLIHRPALPRALSSCARTGNSPEALFNGVFGQKAALYAAKNVAPAAGGAASLVVAMQSPRIVSAGVATVAAIYLWRKKKKADQEKARLEAEKEADVFGALWSFGGAVAGATASAAASAVSEIAAEPTVDKAAVLQREEDEAGTEAVVNAEAVAEADAVAKAVAAPAPRAKKAVKAVKATSATRSRPPKKATKASPARRKGAFGGSASKAPSARRRKGLFGGSR